MKFNYFKKFGQTDLVQWTVYFILFVLGVGTGTWYGNRTKSITPPMALGFKIEHNAQLAGTSRQGELEEITLGDLKQCFGPPHVYGPDGDGKSNFNWTIVFDDGTLATIYDYKILGTGDGNVISPADITYWHVGGYDATAAANITLAVRACQDMADFKQDNTVGRYEILHGGRKNLRLEAIKYWYYCDKMHPAPVYYTADDNSLILHCSRWANLKQHGIGPVAEEFINYCSTVGDGQIYKYKNKQYSCDIYHNFITDAVSAQKLRDADLIASSVPWQSLNHTTDTTLPIDNGHTPGAVVNLETRLIFYNGERYSRFSVIGGRGDGEIVKWSGIVLGAFLKPGEKQPEF